RADIARLPAPLAAGARTEAARQYSLPLDVTHARIVVQRRGIRSTRFADCCRSFLMTASEQASSGQNRGARFIKNVLWSWIGVGATLASGFIISPYLIRKLGPEAYGIWAISLALIENYGFLDLGFRSATVKYVAHHWASSEPRKVNEVINTGLMLSATVAAVVFSAVAAGSRYLTSFFQVTEAHRHDFEVLLILVTFSWCLGW